MGPLKFLTCPFQTGSILTKENSVIFTAIIAEISVISAMIFFKIHAGFIVGTLATCNVLRAYLLKKRFSLKRDTNFNYFKKIQSQEIEIENLKKEILVLKAPKSD